MRDRIDFKRVALVSYLYRARGGPVAFQALRQRLSLLQGRIFAVVIYARRVVNRLTVEHVQKRVHSVLHAHAAHQQHHAAHYAEQRHQAARFVAHAVSQVPFGAEAQRLEAFGLLEAQMPHALGRIGSERVSGCAGKHPAHGQKADKGQKDVYARQHIPGEARRVQRPRGHVYICRHSAVRVHYVPAQPVADAYAERRADQPDYQRVGGIVNEYAPVLEAQRLEGADLRFFAGGDAVHGGDHRKYSYRKEQNRQYGRHRLSLVHLALRLCPRHRFGL